MNDDELAVAREAVAATRAWRDQMRADWGYHREPEEVLDEAVGELLAERDRLRGGIMTAEVHGELLVRMREGTWQEFEAERGRLREAAHGAVLAIETVLIGDNVDMKVSAGELLGATATSLKRALDGSPGTGGAGAVRR